VPHQDFEPREDPDTENPDIPTLLAIWASSSGSDDPDMTLTIIRDISKPPHPRFRSQMTRVICYPLFTLPGTLADPGHAPPSFRRHYASLAISQPLGPISTEVAASKAKIIAQSDQPHPQLLPQLDASPRAGTAMDCALLGSNTSILPPSASQSTKVAPSQWNSRDSNFTCQLSTAACGHMTAPQSW
jgi:hypothetical protein